MKLPGKESSVRRNQVTAIRAELAGSIALHIGDSEDRITEVPGLSLHRRTAPTRGCAATYEPSIVVIAQGRKRVELGGKAFLFDAERYLLTAVDLPVISRVVQASEELPCLGMVFKLQIAVAREVLSRAELGTAEPVPDVPAMGTCETSVEFLSACCRLINLLEDPPDIPFLSRVIEQEIIYRVVRTPEGARLRAIATLGDQSHRIGNVISWIRANYAKPLRIEDLAKTAGMGISTLHQHFRAVTAMSPLQYQKRLRLQAARDHMLIGGLDAAGAAVEVGYESTTQFNREYHRFFGRPPIRDIRAIRSSVAT